MNLIPEQTQLLIKALELKREQVIKDRAILTNKGSKWTDRDADSGTALDKSRDRIDELLAELKKPNGQFSW